MNRQQIIDTIGAQFLVTNVENGEYSYPKALKGIGKDYRNFLIGHSDREHKFVDIRFECDKIVLEKAVAFLKKTNSPTFGI